MLRTASFLLGGLIALSNAHFQLQFPPPRGVFDEDNETTFCDGYNNPASSRTAFPLSGGVFTLNSEHSNWTAGVFLSTKANPTTFSDFASTIVPFSQHAGEGIFCLNLDLANTNGLQLEDGQEVTLEFVYDGGDGELYQCADLTLSSIAAALIGCGISSPRSSAASSTSATAGTGRSSTSGTSSSTFGSSSATSGNPSPTNGSPSPDSGNPSQRSGSVSDGSKKKSNIGAIVGGVVAVVVIILLAASSFHRCRRRRKTNTAELGLAESDLPHAPLSFIVDERVKFAEPLGTSSGGQPAPSLVTPALITMKRDQAAAVHRYDDVHTAPDTLVQTRQGLQLFPGRATQVNTDTARDVSSYSSALSEPAVPRSNAVDSGTPMSAGINLASGAQAQSHPSATIPEAVLLELQSLRQEMRQLAAERAPPSYYPHGDQPPQ